MCRYLREEGELACLCLVSALVSQPVLWCSVMSRFVLSVTRSGNHLIIIIITIIIIIIIIIIEGSKSRGGDITPNIFSLLHQLVRQVNWPTLAWRRRLHCMRYFWRLYYGQGPPQLLCKMPAPATARSGYNLRKPNQVAFPSCGSSRHLNSFLPFAAAVWNDLSADIQSNSTLSSFSSSLHKFFDKDRFSFGLP